MAVTARGTVGRAVDIRIRGVATIRITSRRENGTRRKRGKHWLGGPQGGPQGGSQGGNQYPPQPPPPNFAPVVWRSARSRAFCRPGGARCAGRRSGLRRRRADQSRRRFTGWAWPSSRRRRRSFGAVVDGAPNRKELLCAIFRLTGASRAPGGGSRLARPHRPRATDSSCTRRSTTGSIRRTPMCPESLVRRYGLKRGHEVEVQVRAPEGEERCPAVVKINRVMGIDARGHLQGHAVRGAGPVLSAQAHPARGAGAEGRVDARGRHPHPGRLRPARPDRGAAAHRQDRAAAQHGQRDLDEQPGGVAHHPAGRRAPRGGHRFPAPHQGRGGQLDLRRDARRATPTPPRWSSRRPGGWSRWASTS